MEQKECVMLDWIMKNKEWVFSGIGVLALTTGYGLFWPEENAPPAPQPGSTVQQTHSGTGDNVAGNKIVTTDNSVRQTSISGDNIGRDQIINNYLLGSVDYQQLMAEIKDGEELLAGIPSERTDLRLKQATKLEYLRKKLENFKAEVFRLHELFTRIPINTERLRRAKAHFEKGEFREADAVLKAEEIERDVERLKLEQTAAKDKLAAIEQDLADRANEFLLKAQLSLVTPLAEGEDRFRRTEGYFTQALAAARTAEALFAYALFLYQNNAFSKAEPLYQEALQQRRRDAETDPKAFLQKVANTLNNIALLHADMQDYGSALKEYEEALKIKRSFAETEPKIFLPDVAMFLDNLANLHTQTNDYGSALKEYEEALKIKRSFAETEPKAFLPDVATTLNNLAVLHCQTQDYGPA
ncbi:tetratricopeptide repeat protein [Desulfobulbus sp. F3]|nr:tetratricopeptide repeat protein [Desulfobulbus sp. F3]